MRAALAETEMAAALAETEMETEMAAALAEMEMETEVAAETEITAGHHRAKRDIATGTVTNRKRKEIFMTGTFEMEIPVTRYHKFIKYLCILIQAGTVLYLLFIWNSLPDRIPTHYNGSGVIDSFGSRYTIWICPAAMLLMYQFIGLIERHPSWWNTGVTVTKMNAKRVYGTVKNMVVTMKFVLVLVFAYISIWSSTGRNLGAWFLPVSLALTFVPIIIFLILLSRAAKK